MVILGDITPILDRRSEARYQSNNRPWCPAGNLASPSVGLASPLLAGFLGL